MSQGRDGVHDGDFLSTTWGGGRNEDSGEFSPESSGLPLATGAIPEGFPLSGEVTETGWNTEEESIVCCERCWVDDGNVGLGGCVHLGQDILGKGLGNSRKGALVYGYLVRPATGSKPGVRLLEKIGLDSGFCETGLFGFG